MPSPTTEILQIYKVPTDRNKLRPGGGEGQLPPAPYRYATVKHSLKYFCLRCYRFSKISQHISKLNFCHPKTDISRWKEYNLNAFYPIGLIILVNETIK